MSGNQKSGNEPPSFAIPVGSGAAGLAGRLQSLVRVPIDYILEVHSSNAAGNLDMSISLPNVPSEFEVSKPLAMSMRYTLGNLPVRQISASRTRKIRLTGRSGLSPRQGYTRKGDLIFGSGPDHLKEFDGFIQDYSELLEKSAGKGEFKKPSGALDSYVQPYMVFRALDEKVHLRVEPESWTWRRDADTSRLSYEWELTLTAYGYSPPGGPVNLLAPLDRYGAVVGNAINTVATTIGMLDSVSRNLRRDLDAIVGPSLTALSNISSSLRQLSTGVGALTRWPKDKLAQFVVASRNFERAVKRFQDTVNPFDGDVYRTEIESLKNIFGTTANELDRASHQALAVCGGGPQELRSAEKADEDNDVPPDPENTTLLVQRQTQAEAAVVYVSRIGDTLMGIAQRVLGDALLWPQIAQLNGFTDLHTGPDGTLTPGVRLILPAGALQSRVSGSVLRAATVDETLGVDLRIDPRTGDLVSSGVGDVSTIQGPGNLEQALATRLLTPKNSLALMPGYGLPIAPGLGATRRLLTYCGVHAQDQVLSDPRISEVSSIFVEDEGDALSVHMSIVPISGGPIDVIAPVSSGE